MLLAGWGACATATGDGAFRAPPSARPRMVKAMEVPGAARFATPDIGAPMRRGPLAPGIHRAGTFLVPAARGAPTAFHPRARRSSGGGAGRGIHRSGKYLKKK
jgi:hypothetical protein